MSESIRARRDAPIEITTDTTRKAQAKEIVFQAPGDMAAKQLGTKSSKPLTITREEHDQALGKLKKMEQSISTAKEDLVSKTKDMRMYIAIGLCIAIIGAFFLGSLAKDDVDSAKYKLKTHYHQLDVILSEKRDELIAKGFSKEDVSKYLGKLVIEAGLGSIITTQTFATGRAVMTQATRGMMDQTLDQAKACKSKLLNAQMTESDRTNFKEELESCIKKIEEAKANYKNSAPMKMKEKALNEFKKAQEELAKLESQLALYKSK